MTHSSAVCSLCLWELIIWGLSRSQWLWEWFLIGLLFVFVTEIQDQEDDQEDSEGATSTDHDDAHETTELGLLGCNVNVWNLNSDGWEQEGFLLITKNDSQTCWSAVQSSVELLLESVELEVSHIQTECLLSVWGDAGNWGGHISDFEVGLHPLAEVASTLDLDHLHVGGISESVLVPS